MATDENSIFPFTVNYGGSIGEITFTCVEDMTQFLQTGLPGILVEQAGLVDENAALKRELELIRPKTPPKEEPSTSRSSPDFTSYTQRRQQGAISYKSGELWDENKIRVIDEQAHFELTFPHGRYLTGFVGIVKLRPGIKPLRGSSMLWHDFYINIPEKNFWKGHVLLQQRTEDEHYNIRSLGVNEYVGR